MAFIHVLVLCFTERDFSILYGRFSASDNKKNAIGVLLIILLTSEKNQSWDDLCQVIAEGQVDLAAGNSS